MSLFATRHREAIQREQTLLGDEFVRRTPGALVKLRESIVVLQGKSLPQVLLRTQERPMPED